MKCKTLAGFGVGLIVGAIAGGVIALLYAPKPGKVTRKLIKDAATDAMDILQEGAAEVIDAVQETASETSRNGQAAVKALRS